MNELDMFVNFRRELDVLAFPLIKNLKLTDYIEISEDGETVVGFLMVCNGYVDSIYVEPMYRRRGLARQAVLDYLKDGGEIREMHIINTNDAAKEFWYSIFNLIPEKSNGVDTLYSVESVKKRR